MATAIYGVYVDYLFDTKGEGWALSIIAAFVVIATMLQICLIMNRDDARAYAAMQFTIMILHSFSLCLLISLFENNKARFSSWQRY